TPRSPALRQEGVPRAPPRRPAGAARPQRAGRRAPAGPQQNGLSTSQIRLQQRSRCAGVHSGIVPGGTSKLQAGGAKRLKTARIRHTIKTGTSPPFDPDSAAARKQMAAKSKSQPREPKAYLVDMDGVLIRGNKPVTGAAEFLERLREAGCPFM